jgi:hypothetical protein
MLAEKFLYLEALIKDHSYGAPTNSDGAATVGLKTLLLRAFKRESVLPSFSPIRRE